MRLGLLTLVAFTLAGFACRANRAERQPRPGLRLLDVEIPKLRAHVNDDAHLLTDDEARRLEERLSAHEAATGQQLVLLTRERLPVADLDNYVFTVFNRWNLGRACYDDGMLMAIAVAEHKVRIEVGYGLEGAIPDEEATAIIAEMLPSLRHKQYSAAIETGFKKLSTAAAATPALRAPGCNAGI